MSGAIAAVVVGMIVFWGVLALVAALLDRHRGRQIDHALTQAERTHHLGGRDRCGSFDQRGR